MQGVRSLLQSFSSDQLGENAPGLGFVRPGLVLASPEPTGNCHRVGTTAQPFRAEQVMNGVDGCGAGLGGILMLPRCQYESADGKKERAHEPVSELVAFYQAAAARVMSCPSIVAKPVSTSSAAA
jgi:hypothetical protein